MLCVDAADAVRGCSQYSAEMSPIASGDATATLRGAADGLEGTGRSVPEMRSRSSLGTVDGLRGTRPMASSDAADSLCGRGRYVRVVRPMD